MSDRTPAAATAAPGTFPNLHVSGHPLVRHKVTLLSDERTDTKLFRELVRELTPLLLYEATADLPTTAIRYRTPLEETDGAQIDVRIGLVPILRAGLGLVEAAIDALPRAEVWHLGMYRDEATHRPVSYYNRLPERCPDDLVIVLDPMLATGGSASDAATVLKDWGAQWIKFVGIKAAPEGVALMASDHPDVQLYAASLDRELDANRFIRPGLGDAGDRLFGTGQG
ncbi:MAG: Uracil phosphoribosyltransferase [uncultured Thermomicrobiales bacterium]|uniref:Uracil phosphoribosyltransferase n=1 Tax=uncultured Thermomicrobiales bacterium TaxID=1645740 RepID=A0A6J4U8V3_9BACT|nr:MAG: Uracil phosphoribosyltransferase [uncultured Thermomicrobiales bacterium]